MGDEYVWGYVLWLLSNIGLEISNEMEMYFL